MKPLRLLCIIPLLLLSSLVAMEPPAHSGNAAVQYWQAFAHLPTLNEKEEKLLSEWMTVSLEGDAAKLLQASQASLLYLHRGTALSRCQWDLHYEDGAGLLMPHLAKCRTLALLAALQARSDFSMGKKEQAVERINDVLTLARHAGSEPIIISILVGYKIEDYALDTIATFLPSLEAAQLNKLASHFKNLPDFARVKATISTEKQYMHGWFLKKMDEAEKQKSGEWKTVWKNILEPKPDPKDVLQQRLSRINTYAEARQLAVDLAPVYDQLLSAADLGYVEQSKKLESILAEVRAKNALGGWLLPAFQRTQLAEHRQLARQRLFQAALAVVAHGKDALATMPDPFGSGPFEYQALANGFELTSKLLFNGKPVSYRVGKE